MALEEAGIMPRYIPLRDYVITPCIACDACFATPWRCVLAKQDQTEELFELITGSDAAVFSSPIYFYALPAHFKALIDRCQRFWAKNGNMRSDNGLPTPATAILAAGRPRGEKLFSGALLTMRWFGYALNLKFNDMVTFRGLDKPADIKTCPDVTKSLRDAAQRLVRTVNGLDNDRD